MTRFLTGSLLACGLWLTSFCGVTQAQFFFDDGGYDDGDWDDGGWNRNFSAPRQGTARQYRHSPFSPATQNQNNLGWDNSGWDDGGWDNGWNNNGWNNGWQQQQNWNQYQYQYQQPQRVYSNQPITIAMPTGEPGMCSYVLSSGQGTWNYTMSPGKSQTFNEDRAWKVTFDRGNGFGEQSYNLKPGYYRFRQSSRGWELYRSEAPPAAPIANAPPPPM